MKVKALLKAMTKSEKPSTGRALEAESARALTEPVRYTLLHLGSMPVEEEEQINGKRYSDGLGASAVRTIVVMAKSAHNKGVEVHLDVTSTKIRVQERSSQKLLVDTPIQRICFCTCDGVYNKVFAFIYRVPETEVMECHAFYCGAPQAARALAFAMNGAFIAAYENEKLVQKQLRDANVFPVSIPIYPARHFSTTGASTASSSACSSAGSMNSRSAASGSSSMRSGDASPIESEVDSASLNSTRSANYSADSANGDLVSANELVEKVAGLFAREMLASRTASRSEASNSISSKRSQVVHAVQVHAPPTTTVEQQSNNCRKSWISNGDIQDSSQPHDSALPLRCPTNFSCVLPISVAVASS